MSANPKLSDLRTGDKLCADGGFTCLSEGQICEVHANHRSMLFINCAQGRHFLAAQINSNAEVVGFERVQQ